MTPGEGDVVAQVIEGFTPRLVSSEAAAFAKEVTAGAHPGSANRAKAFLFAASALGAFCQSVGLALDPSAVLSPSVIERCCHPQVTTMSPATRRTVRSNLRAIARRLDPAPPPVLLSRERAKAPYTPEEIASYLALADTQPTEARRRAASALICLGAGAGLVGADMKGVRGTDVVCRSGGVVVCVREGRRPRSVPVLARYGDRLTAAAAWGRGRLLIGGTSPSRRNVTTPLTSSLSGGADLPRIEIARLRATWLCEVAGAIGLRGFMEAAGITCSQRLGDLVATLEVPGEEEAVALLGGTR
jgi:integrase